MMLSHSVRKQLVERARRLFGGLPCRVQAAALPWRVRDGGIEVMLVTSRGTGRWVLPKGWSEASERLSEAAEREAGEEAGLFGRMSPIAVGRYYYAKTLSNGGEWRCEVHVFPMEVTNRADEWPEKAQRTRRWFRAVDAARLVAEPDLAELIAGFAENPRKSAA